MVTKPKSTANLRPHDVQVPASPKVVPPGGKHGRSVPAGVERTAQVLVHEAGSVRKAKKAIDAAAEMEQHSEFREDQLATRLGFASRRELLAASKPFFGSSSERWWATRTADDRWIVWNEQTVGTDKHATLEEAKRSVNDQLPGNERANSGEFPEGFNG